MQYQIFNTCGTSVLTNLARNLGCLDIINKYSNCKNDSEIPKDDYKEIEKISLLLLDNWAQTSIEEVKRQSAELNSLFSWLETREIKESDCCCYLLHTDTYMGELAAQMIEEKLKDFKFQYVCLQRIDNLNTSDFDSFQDGLSNLAKWAFENAVSTDFQKVIFNIAGGFKSFSGFAQILGQFLADETIYKFETGEVILSIPKMPVMMGDLEFRQHFDDYHKISLGIPLNSYDNINSLWVKNGRFTPWGEVAWGNAKRTLYEESVYPVVCGSVSEGVAFRDSLNGLDKSRIKQVNERLDDLCIYKLSNGKKCVKRLDYKKLKQMHEGCTHECDAWADQDCRRLFCNEKEGKIIVEFLGKPLH